MPNIVLRAFLWTSFESLNNPAKYSYYYLRIKDRKFIRVSHLQVRAERWLPAHLFQSPPKGKAWGTPYPASYPDRKLSSQGVPGSGW